MRCQIKGHDNILYVCQSPNCDCMPLCKQCKKNHNPQHFSYLIRYDVAVEKAIKNVDSQIQKLQEYIAPIQKKKQTIFAVSKQIQALKEQKIKLMKRIQDQINRQIKALQDKNQIINTQQSNFYNELKKKMQSLIEMKDRVQRQAKVLRTSLTMQIQHYLYYIGKSNPYFTKNQSNLRGDVNIAQLYVKTQHQMIISQLELRKQILNPKLLKKVNNDSPLYFLIDSKYQTGRYLHYFVPKDNSLELRIYDVQRQKWSKHVNRNLRCATSQFSTVYDHQFNKFYFIGGKKGGEPVKQIISFDLQKNQWEVSLMNLARSNAMVTIILNKKRQNISSNYILIAGGFASENKAMKNWQLFNPLNKRSLVQGEMNFASAAGKLVVFNGDTVFKIGGFANKSKNQLGICPIVQKCDFSSLRQDNRTFKFSYIQVEDLCKQNINDPNAKKYQLYYGGQGAIQINPNQIFVYGGKLSNGREVDESYILNVQQFPIENFEGKQVISNRYYARWINQKPLISEMSFQDFSPCLWKGKLYSLQHLPSRQGQLYKGLIQFDMKSWYQTQNIVDDRL